MIQIYPSILLRDASEITMVGYTIFSIRTNRKGDREHYCLKETVPLWRRSSSERSHLLCLQDWVKFCCLFWNICIFMVATIFLRWTVAVKQLLSERENHCNDLGITWWAEFWIILKKRILKRLNLQKRYCCIFSFINTCMNLGCRYPCGNMEERGW